MIDSRIRCPGEGPYDCEAVFVGEAPGREEVQNNPPRPFIGGSGRLLRSLMGKVEINPRTARITNVILEQPPGNNISLYIDLDKVDPLNTERGEVAREYIAYLKEDLEKTHSNVIVAVGAIPLWVLCGIKGITKWRGSVLESTLLPGRKVIPIIHPAAALRQYIHTHSIAMDLKRVAEQMKFPEIKRPFRNPELNPSFDSVLLYLDELLREEPLCAFDIEVVNEEVDCLSFATCPTFGICIPFTKGQDSYFTPEHEIILWKKIAQVLETCPMVGQNLAFDATFLFQRYGIRVNVADDTMVAHGVCFPDFPKSLAFITSVYTNEPYYKDDIKKWKGLKIVQEQFWLYNAKDSLVCIEALSGLKRDLGRLKLTEIYNRHVKLIPVLTYMQSRGVRLDSEGIKKKRSKLEEVSKTATKALQDICGYAINPNSPQQLGQYFYIEKNLSPYTHKGKITADDTAMKRLVRKGYEEANLVLAIRKANKLVGTYLDLNLDADGRIRGALNPVGTKTGRLSSTKTIFGTGMNMQNQPDVLKKFMLADEGFVMYTPDLEQAELRIYAEVAPDLVLKEIFSQGLNPHQQTAALVLHKHYNEISKEEGSSDLGSGERSEYYWGKTLNFATLYGMGPGKFSLEYEIPLREAKELIEKLHEVRPALRSYWTWVREQLKRDLTLTNPLGRRRLFLDRWGDELFREAYNFIPQSTVADIINERALIYLYYNQDLFHHVDLLNQEHDSVWFQLPLTLPWSEHARILNLLVQNVERPLTWRGNEFVIPLEVKLGVGVGWTEKSPKSITAESLQLAYETSVKKHREATSESGTP